MRGLERLARENEELRAKYAMAVEYIRRKVNQLLTVMGTSPIKPEELDDKTLIDMDPIGIISDSFVQILRHLHETNDSLKLSNEEIHAILEALKKSEERYRDLFENANDLIQSVALDTSLLYVNRAWRETLGYSEQEVRNLSIFDVIHPDCFDQCMAEFRSIVSGEKSGRVDTIFMTKDGRKILVEGNVNAILDDGRPVGTRGVFRDITERKTAEEMLASERERLAVTLRSIMEGVIATDTRGNVVLMNKTAERLTDWTQEEAVGRPITEVFLVLDEKTHACCENPAERALSSGEVVEGVNRVLLAKDAKERIVSGSVAPVRDRRSAIVGSVIVFRDVTEKRKIEERLLKAEKIESLGVLAGGIAHDFNNLLNAVMGNVELAMTFLNPEDKIYENLVRAEKATLRARDLTTQLLTFSKGGAPIKKAASINEVIRDSADFALRGSNVRCEFSFAEDLWKVEIDEGQISQVINNLVINAMQAMPEGGIVSIIAENTDSAPPGTLLLNGERYIKITIKDEGIGIPREHLDRIFEPYFTTKQAGSGLGLATTYSIMRSHEGFIDVESEVGLGTTFYLYLPAFSGVIEKEKVVEKSERPKTGKERILVMDDDDLLRQTAGDILIQLGYETAFAADGAEAIAMYERAKESGKPYDAVIMDLTVPGGMGGREAIKQLIEIDPHVKAIVSSGYSSDAIMANYRQYGFAGVLAKPYRSKDLGEILGRIISK